MLTDKQALGQYVMNNIHKLLSNGGKMEQNATIIKAKEISKRKPIAYISGPVTGTSDFKNRFSAAEDYLKCQGYDVINPTMVTLPQSCNWDNYMAIDIQLLSLAEYVYMLQGWRNSPGSCVEYGIAYASDKTIIYQ